MNHQTVLHIFGTSIHWNTLTRFQMNIEHGLSNKTLLTELTHVGSFPCMGSDVDDQTGSLRETLVTILAHIGSFTRMNPHVFHQYGFLSEAFPTIRATERFVTGMGPLVEFQLLLTGQDFPANITDSHITRVNVHVKI